MRSLLLAVLALALLGCGGSSPPPPAPVANKAPPPAAPAPAAATGPVRPACSPSDECVLQTMVYFRDVMCACTTAACGHATVDEMSAWAQDAAKTMADAQPDEAAMQRLSEIGVQLADCTSRVLGEVTGDTDMSPAPSQPHTRSQPVGPKPASKPTCKQGGDAAKCAQMMMTYFADLMCSCADAACATQVSDEMSKWAHAAAAATSGQSAKPSADDLDKMQRVATRLAQCMTDATMATP